MVLVLFPVNVIFEEDFRLVIHLGIDVLAEEAADQSRSRKRQRCQGSDLQTVRVGPLEGIYRCSNNFIRLRSDVLVHL